MALKRYPPGMPRGEYLQYGGQAVVEGVMMRSPRFFSVACRAPNGSILVQTEAVEKTWIGKQKWLKYPFLRGSLALIDSMALGSRALKFATNVQIDPAYEKPHEQTLGGQLQNGYKNDHLQLQSRHSSGSAENL